MSSITFKKGSKKNAGEWENWRGSIFIGCPKCGKYARLSAGHMIDSNGNVSPSVVCFNDECDFHEYIKLEN